MIAAEDIYDESGTQLWVKNAEITPALQQRLRLRNPLEKTLSVIQEINLDAIYQEALRRYDFMPALPCFMGAEKATVLKPSPSSNWIRSPFCY